MLLVRQQDKPGIIAAVSAILGRESVNISFMTVSVCSSESSWPASALELYP